MLRRLAALLVLALAMVAGVAAPAAAQVPPGLAATLTLPTNTTSVGTSVLATATFTPPTAAAALVVRIRLVGGLGLANLTLASNSAGLTNCTPGPAQIVTCNWDGNGGQTLAVSINATAVGEFAVFVEGGPEGGSVFPLDDSNFFVTQATTTTAPTTPTTPPTTPTTPPTTPTTAPVTPTSAPVTPTSAAIAPTSAAATTDPGTLPATGGSDSTALIALVVLALGAFLLIIVRKFREA